MKYRVEYQGAAFRVWPAIILSAFRESTTYTPGLIGEIHLQPESGVREIEINDSVGALELRAFFKTYNDKLGRKIESWEFPAHVIITGDIRKRYDNTAILPHLRTSCSIDTVELDHTNGQYDPESAFAYTSNTGLYTLAASLRQAAECRRCGTTKREVAGGGRQFCPTCLM